MKIVVDPLQNAPGVERNAIRTPPSPRGLAPRAPRADCPDAADRTETPTPPDSLAAGAARARRTSASATGPPAFETKRLARSRPPASDSPSSRMKMLRNSRAVPSARSAWRPSQNKWSATRLGRSWPLHRGVTGVPGGCNSVTGATGPSASTHTSLVPWPTNIDSLGVSEVALACRQRPRHHLISLGRGHHERARAPRAPAAAFPPTKPARSTARQAAARPTCSGPREYAPPVHLFLPRSAAATLIGRTAVASSADRTTNRSRFDSTNESEFALPHHQVSTDGSFKSSLSSRLEIAGRNAIGAGDSTSPIPRRVGQRHVAQARRIRDSRHAQSRLASQLQRIAITSSTRRKTTSTFTSPPSVFKNTGCRGPSNLRLPPACSRDSEPSTNLRNTSGWPARGSVAPSTDRRDAAPTDAQRAAQ